MIGKVPCVGKLVMKVSVSVESWVFALDFLDRLVDGDGCKSRMCTGGSVLNVQL